MPRNADRLLERIRDQYLGSGDFNGLPFHALTSNDDTARAAIIELITRGDVDMVRGDRHPNPHIKAFLADPIEDQLSKIEASGLGHGCLYPSPGYLARIGAGDGEEAPFTKELKLGAPQLSFRVFDLRMLEWYRNDPRYQYEVDDIHGTIYQEAGTEDAAGRILQDRLEYFQFGFAYDRSLKRVVAAFVRYLHDLTPEQQRYLTGFMLEGEYQLHPEFYRTQIIGDFPEKMPIYDAFLEEKKHINEMSRLMGKPPLFRSDSTDRPQGFGILIRPTKKEFRDFALQLDQLLSDDLNRAFFDGDIPVTETLTREDASTTTQSIGTIMLLERWLRKNFRPREPAALDELLKSIRKVRKERQKPAHVADDNDWNEAYIEDQRKLIEEAFDVVRTIRMFFENHPAVRGYEIPDWLRDGKVISF